MLIGYDVRIVQGCVWDNTGMFAHALHQDYKGHLYETLGLSARKN